MKLIEELFADHNKLATLLVQKVEEPYWEQDTNGEPYWAGYNTLYCTTDELEFGKFEWAVDHQLELLEQEVDD